MQHGGCDHEPGDVNERLRNAIFEGLARKEVEGEHWAHLMGGVVNLKDCCSCDLCRRGESSG